MGRHGTANIRYGRMIVALPLILSLIALIWVNPVTRTWLATYTPFLSAINTFYFLTFLIAGLIATFFEIPFTRPDMITDGGAGKLGTLLVAIIAGLCYLTAGLIITNVYNITTDVGVYNTILGYILLPAIAIMFGLELYVIVLKNKAYAFHGGLR